MSKKTTAKVARSRPNSDEPAKNKTRAYLSQSDVPGCSFDQAIRVPRTISDECGNDPVTPLQLAKGLDMTPTSGPFRTLCGASIAFGLTEGGSSAQQITLTTLGKRVVSPQKEGDDMAAMREALMKPRVLNEFLTKYNGCALPRRDIALNVLEHMRVPRPKVETVLDLILESAEKLGFISEIKDKQYIEFKNTVTPATQSDDASQSDVEVENDNGDTPPPQAETVTATTNQSEVNRRVFITHGKNRDFLDPLKKLLGFGELTPVVSVETPTVSKPLPDKVMDDMRSCSAAIIHVDAERVLMDKDATEHVTINENVLIEIGAAMALYGHRFILLVREGVRLPSNLQGLYEVRYTGESLDGDATIRLLGAINDIKNNPLPNRYAASE